MNQATATDVSVLVLRGSPHTLRTLVARLGGHAHVEMMPSVEETLEALRHRHIDLVVSETSELLPDQAPATASRTPHADLQRDPAIGIVASDGKLLWANPAMAAAPDELREEVCRACVAAFPKNAVTLGALQHRPQARHFRIATAAHESYEMTATPVVNLKSQVTHVAAVVSDTAQRRGIAADPAGRELLVLDEEQITRLDAHERLGLLEQKVLRCIRRFLRQEHFSVRVLDPKTGRLDLVLRSGMAPETETAERRATVDGNGICGFVAATGRSYVCGDTDDDPRYLTGMPEARSSVSVPLYLSGRMVGVLNVESARVDDFDETDRRHADSLAWHLAIALHILKLLVHERATTTNRLARQVTAEINKPINDILTEVSELVDAHATDDDLCARLEGIRGNAQSVREGAQQVCRPQHALRRARDTVGNVRDPVLSDKQILIADDEEMIRDTVRDVLTSYGCRVSIANDGRRAIDLIHDRRFDLVMSDIRMPHKNGYEVFAAAKDADGACPVILMTGFGYDPNHSIVRARREGLAAVLFKPFKVDQLLGEIRNALQSIAR